MLFCFVGYSKIRVCSFGSGAGDFLSIRVFCIELGKFKVFQFHSSMFCARREPGRVG